MISPLATSVVQSKNYCQSCKFYMYDFSDLFRVDANALLSIYEPEALRKEQRCKHVKAQVYNSGNAVLPLK